MGAISNGPASAAADDPTYVCPGTLRCIALLTCRQSELESYDVPTGNADYLELPPVREEV